MNRHPRLFATLCVLIATALPIAAQIQEERVDLDAYAKIRAEGSQHSQVMQITSYLTDVYGPRLTGSPNIKAAAQWVTRTMNEWGFANVKLETWGPFGRGWSNEHFQASLVKPYALPLIGYPKAWTPGTKGTISGDVVMGVVNTAADLDQFRGKLRGKFVMAAAMPAVAPQFQAPGSRYTEQQLQTLVNPAPQRGGGGNRGGNGGGQRGDAPPAPLTAQQRLQFYIDEGVLGVIDTSRGTGGTVFVQSGGTRGVNDPPAPVQITLAVEHYGLIARDLEKGIPVTIEANVQNKFYDDDLNSFNIVGEIPGGDKRDEVVMVGAHFDSWHSGTGATDNAAGSAVMMEAMRILKAAGLPMRRTARIALWTGEEEGLLGSQAYVRDHFAVRQTMELKPEHSKMSVYFNVDNGTGQIRGVYMEGNEAARPVFDAWMQPFRDFGMNTLTMRSTGGTDHGSFNNVGLPGFQFIQDPIEYDSRTHHSNMDMYERVQSKDMMQNAIIVASFVYQAANRDELFPRKPLPSPPPAQGERGGR